MDATHFPEYLQRVMLAAGIPTAADMERAAAKAGLELDQNLVSRWLRGTSKGTPSVAKLRPVAQLVGVPLAEMMVHAGLVEPHEVNLTDLPELPKVRTVEDQIRADKRLTPDKQELAIQLLRTLREEHSSRTGVRTRQHVGAPDQGIDTDDNRELSG